MSRRRKVPQKSSEDPLADEELLVSPDLCYLTFFEDDDLICCCQQGQMMGHQEAGLQ